MKSTRLLAFVHAGLESIAAREIRALGGGVGQTKTSSGRVHFEGPPDAVYRANLNLRTVERILVPLGAVEAAHKSDLVPALKALPFERWIAPGAAVSVKVATRRCRLYHTGLIEEAVREALLARGLGSGEAGEDVGASRRDAGQERNTEERVATVDVRGADNRWEVCVDSSGRGLHRRGWRKATAKAPIRETLAAGLLMKAGWLGKRPLLDPMCGSGTVPIEAAIMAAGIAPGLNREFAFEDFPDFDAARWAVLQEAAQTAERRPVSEIQGSDASSGAVRAAVSNALRAGVADSIQFRRRTVEELPPVEKGSPPGLVLLNPPYGRRLGDEDAKKLAEEWADWGAALRSKRPDWSTWVVAPSPELARAAGSRKAPVLRFFNGGIGVGLYRLS